MVKIHRFVEKISKEFAPQKITILQNYTVNLTHCRFNVIVVIMFWFC